MSEAIDHIDLPILAELGVSLRAAMRAAEAAEPVPTVDVPDGRRWWRSFPAISTVLVLGIAGTAAAAATLTILRGSPIPAPQAADLQPAMTQKASTQHVLDLRAADPAGTLPSYALRTGTSEAGLTCVTVGQVDEGDFGIVGDDGRFRTLPATLVDGCGAPSGDDAAVAGTRVFDASAYGDVRTAVYAVGGPKLRTASITQRGVTRPLPVKDGAVLEVIRGYPEDSAVALRLGFEDGKTATHAFGRRVMAVLDPSGQAWRLNSGAFSGRPASRGRVCTSVTRLRRGASSQPATPSLCEPFRSARVGLPIDPFLFAVRTLHPGDHGGNSLTLFGQWHWHQAPARTIAWGWADQRRVKHVTVTAPGQATVTRAVTNNGAFAVVYPASVESASVRVAFALRDGTTKRYARRAGAHLEVGR